MPRKPKPTQLSPEEAEAYRLWWEERHPEQVDGKRQGEASPHAKTDARDN
jgi:hypothetical protein